MAGRDRRARATGKLGTARGERYALIPEEVMSSAAYAAQPDFAKVVLFALAARYHGRNNGDLSLTTKDAKTLGVTLPWKLYAGLNLLKKTELIECTRQGRLERGRKICSLYALTWRGIDPSQEKAAYDASTTASPIATHRWARWEQPADWARIVSEVKRANHGRSKNPVSTTLGNGRSTTLGTEGSISDQPPRGMEALFPVPKAVDASKTLGRGAPGLQVEALVSAPAPTPLPASNPPPASYERSTAHKSSVVDLAAAQARVRA